MKDKNGAEIAANDRLLYMSPDGWNVVLFVVLAQKKQVYVEQRGIGGQGYWYRKSKNVLKLTPEVEMLLKLEGIDYEP